MVEWVTTGEVARALGYHPNTVREWCETGRIAGAQRPVPGAQWRIPRTWLDERLEAVRRAIQPVRRPRTT